MRTTGPTLRRRNHAWLQMRRLKKRADWVARRQELDDDTSDDDVDTSDDGADASDSESDDSLDSSDDESDDEPTPTQPPSRPPLISASVGIGVGKGARASLPTKRAEVSAGVALAAEEPDVESESESDGIESDSDDEAEDEDEDDDEDDTATPPAGTTSSAAPAPTTTSPPQISATSGPSVNIPALATDRQANQHEGSGVGMSPMPPQNNLNPEAVAGIVIGVLAFLGLVAGAILFWRKWRRSRNLPFLPFTRGGGADGSRAPYIVGPFPDKVGDPAPVKTNTQIMDELMKAAYATDGGANGMQGAYGSTEKLPLPEQQNVFLDEKAYAALAGPLTPGSPKKPVMEWLTEVKTPTQPNGPEMPPSPQMPPSVTMQPMPSGGRVPDPPKPAYFGRETMTTETTNTSARWYG